MTPGYGSNANSCPRPPLAFPFLERVWAASPVFVYRGTLMLWPMAAN